MQQITVASVKEEHAKNDATKIYYVVTDTKGLKMSTFHAEVLTLQPGDVIDAEIIVNVKGDKQYTNLESFKLVKTAPQNTPQTALAAPPANGKHDRSPEIQASIETQCACKIVADLVISGKIPEGHTLYNRLMFWLTATLPVLLPVQQASGSLAPTPQSQNAPSGELESDRDFDAIPSATRTIPPRPDPKTRQEFQQWCGTYKFDVHDIVKATGVPLAKAIGEIAATVNTLKAKFPEKFKEG